MLKACLQQLKAIQFGSFSPEFEMQTLTNSWCRVNL